jgi:hypothetical protein
VVAAVEPEMVTLPDLVVRGVVDLHLEVLVVLVLMELIILVVGVEDPAVDHQEAKLEMADQV